MYETMIQLSIDTVTLIFTSSCKQFQYINLNNWLQCNFFTKIITDEIIELAKEKHTLLT